MKRGNALTAAEIISQLLIKIPQRYPGTRVWRQNTGKAVGWDSVRMAIGHIQRGAIPLGLSMLQRPITFGVPGTPDICGIFHCHGVGLWGGVEVKAGPDKLREDQVNFRAMILGSGGIFVVAREIEQAIGELGEQLECRRVSMFSASSAV